jgi:hypothetical protein
MKEMQTVCPWCESNIIWDEEIGPEKHCPHCDNELSGYRTLELDGQLDELDDDDVDGSYSDDAADGEWEADTSILRSTREIAANSKIQSLLDVQFEMPECTNCREYMLEVGEQSIGQQEQFAPIKVPHSGQPLVPATMKVTWYVCPSCYRTDSYLSIHDRKHMLDTLSEDQ